MTTGLPKDHLAALEDLIKCNYDWKKAKTKTLETLQKIRDTIEVRKEAS